MHAILKAIRLHQWAKNLLIFLPLLLAHQLNAQPSAQRRRQRGFVARLHRHRIDQRREQAFAFGMEQFAERLARDEGLLLAGAGRDTVPAKAAESGKLITWSGPAATAASEPLLRARNDPTRA